MSKDSPKSQQSGIASRANDVAKQAADALFPVHLDRGSTFDLNMDRRMEARAIISRILKAEYGELEKAAREYFDGYVQDEASDRTCCCTEGQHESAKRLRAALKVEGA
jgi:hypothetical protein